jgi:phosphonate transport system permease protein
MSAAPALLLGAFAAVTAASFWFLRLDAGGLFSGEGAKHMLAYAGSFFPPDTSPAFLGRVLYGSLETLAISGVGTLLAVLAGLALALPAAGRFGGAARAAARFALNLLRSIPELVWAALMVIAAGLGPFAGTLALALHTTGVLGRLFAETLENTPPEPTAALRNAGTPALAAFLYGTLPGILPQVASYALYRWENNIRMAAVLGLVGAGGLGQLLYVSLSLFKQAEASTVILAMLVLVAIVDGLSAWLRRFLGRSGA